MNNTTELANKLVALGVGWMSNEQESTRKGAVYRIQDHRGRNSHLTALMLVLWLL